MISTRLLQIELRDRYKTMSSILVRTNSSFEDPVPHSVTSVTKTLFLLFMLLIMFTITNFNFTIYHIYMRKKPEFSNRLLNVLYSFHAYLLQFGSFLILLVFCDNTFYHFIPTELLVTIRMLLLSCVFINIFFLAMATVIQHFMMDVYLLISVRITRKIIYSTTFLLSIIINIFVKLSVNGKENNDELENYKSVIKRACIWLNMMALIMSLMVILRNMKFYLKKPFFDFLGQAHNNFLRPGAKVTPIVTMEMEMRHIEVANIDGLEPYNTNANSILGNHSIDIDENIRLVISNTNVFDSEGAQGVTMQCVSVCYKFV